MIKTWNRKPIIELWNDGRSAREIVEQLELPITVRQVQRIGAEHGNRKQRASGRLRADQDFLNLYRPILVQLMEARGKSQYVCGLCDVRTGKKMTIHHTKYEGATLDDLVFACWKCQHAPENHGLA